MEVFNKEDIKIGSIVIKKINFSDISEITNLVENIVCSAIKSKSFVSEESKEALVGLIGNILNRLKILQEAMKIEDRVVRNSFIMTKISNEEILGLYELSEGNQSDYKCIYIDSDEVLKTCTSGELCGEWGFMQSQHSENIFSELLSNLFHMYDCEDKDLWLIYNGLVEGLRYLFSTLSWETGEALHFDMSSLNYKVHSCDVKIGDYLIGCIVRKLKYFE